MAMMMMARPGLSLSALGGGGGGRYDAVDGLDTAGPDLDPA